MGQRDAIVAGLLKLRKEFEGKGGCKMLSKGRDCLCPLCVIDRTVAFVSSTRKIRCQRPSWIVPPTTVSVSDAPSRTARAWAWPFARSPGARFTVRIPRSSCL